MAAYAALVSLTHIIEQIQNHPRPPFYLDNKHAECLIEKVTFLQKFLEDYSHVRNKQVDHLQSRIAEVAYAAEDVIETHVVDQILAQSAQHGRRICSVDFYQNLQKVVQDMDLIENEVMEIQTKIGPVQYIQQHTGSSTTAAGSLRSPSTRQITVEGWFDVLGEIMDKLTRKQRPNLQVIPIVGMGGIGKTTLAKHVYDDPLIKQNFDIRTWAIISHEYSTHKIISELLLHLNNQYSQESLSGESEMKLRDRLYKSLCGKRYLIMLDDMWSIDVWDKIKSLFPNNNNGSRAIITTRLSEVALALTGGDKGLEMKFLDDDMSWNLLCKTVFGEDSCPLELEETGKKIAKSCNGLPLSIVVIGGLLAKSEKTPKYWEYIAENLHSSEEMEHCLSQLYTSYNHLPIHLKPCFLYMGTFKEDSNIYFDNLIMKWVAEGFLKSITGKSLEEVAENYLEDLIGRNLVLVHKRKRNGKIASCMIHDLLRDLCLREIDKDNFLYVMRHHSPNNFPQVIKTQRRIAIHQSTIEDVEDEFRISFTPQYLSETPDASQSMSLSYYLPEIHDTLQSASHARSIICSFFHSSEFFPSPNFRLLRILEAIDEPFSDYPQGQYSLEAFIFQLLNLRYIVVFGGRNSVDSGSLSSPYLFWNLQTLIITDELMGTLEIWKMPLLRHVQVHTCTLPNPGADDFVLGNLQTLAYAEDFKCTEEMVNKIPNIKKLKIYYDGVFKGSHFCLNNLDHLHKLEKLCCHFKGPTRNRRLISREDLLQNLTFPQSLKKLTMYGCLLHWEDITTKIGSLPHLQELKLKFRSFVGPKWETVAGQFRSLKLLLIEGAILNGFDLECWTTESTHFPCLEHLVLQKLFELEEIPESIGEIQTLQSIELHDCNHSLVSSAKKIVEEQEELGNGDLKVRVRIWSPNEAISRLASHNFQVELFY